MNRLNHASSQVFILKTYLVVAFVLIAAILPNAQARDLIDFNLDVTTDKRGDDAKQEAFDVAVEKASLKLIEDIVGPEKTSKVWSSLKTKILKNSTRFVVFIKGSTPVEAGGHTRVTVSMRLSPDNLETILREEGALATGTLRILPIVTIGAGKGNLYAWWAASPETTKPTANALANPGLPEQFKKFVAILAAKMKTKSIYVIDPSSSSFRMSVPVAYRTPQLSREDQGLLAQYFKADLVLSGRLESGRPASENSDLKLVYDLQLWQAKSGRGVTELQRIESLSSDHPKVIVKQIESVTPKVAEEFSSRLAEIMASGNLNLNVVRVAVTGNMTARQETEFKRQLSQLKEVKVLKERLFEPGRVTFEAETPVSARELGQQIQRTQFPLYQVAVDGVQDDSLALTVRAMSQASAQ
jgi:hypothetical protein